MTELLRGGLRTEGEPHSFASLDGKVRLHIDRDEECYYIEADFDHDPRWLATVRAQALDWGLEPLDDEECPAEVRDTCIRVWLAEIFEDDDEPLAPVINLLPRPPLPSELS